MARRHRRKFSFVALAAWGLALSCGRLGYELEETSSSSGAAGTTTGPTTSAGGGADASSTGAAAGSGVGGLGSTASSTGSPGAGGASTSTAAGGASGAPNATGGASGLGGSTLVGGAAGTAVGGGAGSGGAELDGSAPCPTCPLLYWKFDEASGTVAIDSSGNGFDGTYIGASPSTLLPPVTFPDPLSRAFVTAKQQAVELPNAPAALKPASNLTISVWYRSPATDTLGGELVSLGENYALVLRPARTGTIELLKALSGGAMAWVVCSATVPNYLGSTWHHVAGVITPTGMRLYVDGARVGTSPEGSNIAYTLGTSLFVGRNGNGDTGVDFDGYIDEVRIYGRALSDAEIAALAAGAP